MVAILLYSLGWSAQKTVISEINQECSLIIKLSSTFTKDTQSLDGYFTKPGINRAIIYKDSSNKIRLICTETNKIKNDSLLGEINTIKEVHEYYYKDDMIFVDEKEIEIKVPMFQSRKQRSIENNDVKNICVKRRRYYFNGPKLLSFIDQNGKLVRKNSKEFRDAERRILIENKIMYLTIQKTKIKYRVQ